MLSDAITEEWRPVIGFEGFYEVSNLGRVRTLHTYGRASAVPDRILKPQLGPQLDGAHRRYNVTLYRPGGRSVVPVHLIVATAFLGPRHPGYECNHKDTNIANNAASNLEWLTKPEHRRHSVENGLVAHGEQKKAAKLTDAKATEILRRYTGRWGGMSALAREYGISNAMVEDLIRGRTWKHLPITRTPQTVTRKRRSDHVD